MDRCFSLPHEQFSDLTNSLDRVSRATVRLPLDRLNMPATSDIVAVYRDGCGDWIGWTRDQPDLAAFTLKAYPNGGGIPCPAGNPGMSVSIQQHGTPACVTVSVVSVRAEREGGLWWWSVDVQRLTAVP